MQVRTDFRQCIAHQWTGTHVAVREARAPRAAPPPPKADRRPPPALAWRAAEVMMRLAPIVLAALLASLCGSLCAAVAPARPASPPAATAGSDQRDAKNVLDAIGAVVRVKTRALPDARSNRSLGREREGSGVVLRDSGLVLTIGYLILEADSIELTDNNGKVVPATIAGYDHATGFGLLRPVLPLSVKGAELGVSADTAEYDNMIFATYGGRDNASLAMVASKRRFAGYWEYLIDDAIFTVPPRGDHSGAALFNRDGKLIGIGSLIVLDAVVPNRRLPGNMFVPVDLLKPIIGEMVGNAGTRDAMRPWLGVNTQEIDGRLFVIRVQEEGPAEQAGIRSGDVILSVQGQAVTTLEDFYQKLWSSGQAGTAVALRVLQGTEVKNIRVQSINRADYLKIKPSL
jgi:S1-C subfamily serine protease